MPDWNTRLEIKLGDKTISPIDNFTPTFNTPHMVIHSVEADNVGLVRQPFTFTFTMTVKAIGSVVADLTELCSRAPSSRSRSPRRSARTGRSRASSSTGA